MMIYLTCMPILGNSAIWTDLNYAALRVQQTEHLLQTAVRCRPRLTLRIDIA